MDRPRQTTTYDNGTSPRAFISERGGAGKARGNTPALHHFPYISSPRPARPHDSRRQSSPTNHRVGRMVGWWAQPGRSPRPDNRNWWRTGPMAPPRRPRPAWSLSRERSAHVGLETPWHRQGQAGRDGGSRADRLAGEKICSAICARICRRALHSRVIAISPAWPRPERTAGAMAGAQG